MKFYDYVKAYGDTWDGLYWHVPGGQECEKLPRVYADGIEIKPFSVFNLHGRVIYVVEQPGNFNGSVFQLYYDQAGMSMVDMAACRKIIKAHQDAIKITFHSAVITESEE